MRDRFIRLALSIPIVSNLSMIIFNFYARKNVEEIGESAVFEVAKKNSSAEKHWYIRTSVPRNSSFKNWGDYYFAQELIISLEKLNQNASLLFRSDKDEFNRGDINLVIRGLFPSKPNKNATNVLWVISHPNQVGIREIKSYDYVFAASESWAKKMSDKSGKQVQVLNQATNPDKFFSHNLEQSSIDNSITFVGNSVNRRRNVVLDVIESGFSVDIFGLGWVDKVPRNMIKASHIDNADLPELYRNSKIVLNDHWKDMQKNGFLSNRLFDAVACGATVISDKVAGLKAIFGDFVYEYSTKLDLLKVLEEVNSIESQKSSLEIENFGKENSFDTRVRQLIDVIY